LERRKIILGRNKKSTGGPELKSTLSSSDIKHFSEPSTLASDIAPQKAPAHDKTKRHLAGGLFGIF